MSVRVGASVHQVVEGVTSETDLAHAVRDGDLDLPRSLLHKYVTIP
jgi:hypothetical protein